jgi:hypothetical protein
MNLNLFIHRTLGVSVVFHNFKLGSSFPGAHFKMMYFLVKSQCICFIFKQVHTKQKYLIIHIIYADIFSKDKSMLSYDLYLRSAFVFHIIFCKNLYICIFQCLVRNENRLTDTTSIDSLKT